MIARFNPPPFWQQYLPANFQPSSDWIPDVTWGAPPAGWAMWVDTETGYPTAPPEAYRNNPYLFMSVMPGMPEQSVPAEPALVDAMSGAEATKQFSMQASTAALGQPAKGKKPMAKGLKITLWVAGIIAFGSVLGSCGGDNETAAPAATPSATASDTPASATPSASPTEQAADTSAAAEAEASAKAESEASAKAEADAKAEEEAAAS